MLVVWGMPGWLPAAIVGVAVLVTLAVMVCRTEVYICPRCGETLRGSTHAVWHLNAVHNADAVVLRDGSVSTHQAG